MALMMTPNKNRGRPILERTVGQRARVGTVSVGSRQNRTRKPTARYTVSVVGDIPPDLADRVAHAHARAMLAGGSPDRASRSAKKEAQDG